MKNREIKFRAFDIGAQKMHYNVLTDGVMIICQFNKLDDGEGPLIEPMIYSSGSENFKLMQFTGIKDKSGNDIYEGDIVECYYNEYHGRVMQRVYFCSKHGGFRIEFKTGNGSANQELGHYLLPDDGINEKLVVVGNIYESPNLLKSY